jgi:hypothetical protein
MNNHSHPTHEEETECAIKFGECWYTRLNKPQRGIIDYSNRPLGVKMEERNKAA